MANTCTYDEVLAGNGVFKRDSTRSVSVKRMQMKLYKLQYSIGTPDGIFGEDTINSTGQCAVAKEIYNRKNSTRTFLQRDNTWKGYVYGTMIQYEVMTGDASGTKNSRAPDVYTDSWSYCVGLAKLLCEGRKPSSRLGGHCFHVGKSSSYPSNAVESTKIQIPSGTGNKFYDTISNP